MTELLRGEGIEPDTEMLRELLALRQKKALEAITAQEMDLGQLEAVSGGIRRSKRDGICNGTANCDGYFISHPDTPKDDRCIFIFECDQFAC